MADDLDPNAADRWVSVIRQAGSLAPAVGPVATELLTQVIPRQRMDRVVEHIRRIDYRLQVIEEETAGAREVFERNARSEYGTAIIEDSVIQSARTVEPESRERIAALVVRSLTEEELQHERTRKLLNLYGELTYPEIIWLLNFAGAGERFKQRHDKILSASLPTHDEANARGRLSFEPSDSASILAKSYADTLRRLGLLKLTESRLMVGYTVTTLGSLLAHFIQLHQAQD